VYNLLSASYQYSPKKADSDAHIPGKPPFPFIASIWRIIFFWFPPFIIRMTFCICSKYHRLTGYVSPLLRFAAGS